MAVTAILDFQNSKFSTVGGFKGLKYLVLPNLVEISGTVAEIWRFFDFSRWRPPPSWIFKVLKF